MGWGRSLFFAEGEAARTAADCERHIQSLRQRQRMQVHVDRSQDEELRALRKENGELKLYLAALVDLLIARQVIDRDEFARLVELIDASDGQTDGQFVGALAPSME